MKRAVYLSWLPILLLGPLSLPAWSQQDTPETVVAQCSGDIPRDKIDDCLERVRVIDETNPSAQLQSLEAQLERRSRHREMEGAQDGSNEQMARDQGAMPNEPSHDQHPYDEAPPAEGPTGNLAPPSDDTGQGDLTPPDGNSQGPPPNDTPPQDDSETQGPGR